jgi:hypothetical protein
VVSGQQGSTRLWLNFLYSSSHVKKDKGRTTPDTHTRQNEKGGQRKAEEALVFNLHLSSREWSWSDLKMAAADARHERSQWRGKK